MDGLMYLRNLIRTSTDVDDDGASGDSASARAISLRAQVAAQVQIAAAVQATILPQPKFGKYVPSPIQVNGLGRPKESGKEEDFQLSGKEEDFQRWSKKTEAFFAGVIKESETMLEWAAEQTTHITTELDRS